jgi:hypothetical protein
MAAKDGSYLPRGTLSFKALATELARLTDAAVQHLLQADEWLLKERELLDKERATLTTVGRECHGDHTDPKVAEATGPSTLQCDLEVGEVTIRGNWIPLCDDGSVTDRGLAQLGRPVSRFDEACDPMELARVPSPRIPDESPEALRVTEELRQELGAADDNMRLLRQLQADMTENKSEREDMVSSALPAETVILDVPLPAVLPLEAGVSNASVVQWVSAPSGSKSAPRAYPSETLFKDSGGTWLRAGQLNPDGGNELLGPGGEYFRTKRCVRLPDREDFVRLRTPDGSIMVAAEHKLLFEGTKGDPQPSKVGKYRSWGFQLPRIFDGDMYRVVECVETYAEMHEMVEVSFEDDERSSVRAWTECPLGVSRDFREKEKACKLAEAAFRQESAAGTCVTLPNLTAGLTNGIVSWVSMPVAEGSQVARYFPSTTIFRRPSGQRVRAVDICTNWDAVSKIKLVGPEGLEVEVTGATLVTGVEENLVRICTKHGAFLVPENHALLVEDEFDRGKTTVVKAHELKRVRGPLPRLYDGERFQFIDKVEIVIDTTDLVGLCVGCLPTLAFSLVGEVGLDLKPNSSRGGIHTDPPSCLLQSAQPSAPPSLVVVEREAQPETQVACPFADGSRRVPLSLLYACTAPVGPRSAGVMNTMSLQASPDLQQSKIDAAEPLS